MCPSYRATRDEKHSTRGRAHLLFEMMHGGPLAKGWKSDAVEDALDLCLGCKGCKRDCPVNVDMATYKAEFRSHYYAGRLRPRAAYSMGLIHWWARAASAAPALANLLSQTPGLSAAVKLIGGIAQQRKIPEFPEATFRDWFARHPTRNPAGPEVLLFPDTFNNFLRPETAIAAVHVLEAAGWRVTIPERILCCGRPLYDWGMLDTADRLLRLLLDTIGPALARGVPVIGLEPACMAAFRDEIPALFPNDARAQQLQRQSYMLAQFIAEHCPDFHLPAEFGDTALVQIHCHQHAVLHPKGEIELLKKAGFDTETMATGCCGMAGSFGFEAAKYPVSVTVAEDKLLPRLRRAEPDAVVVANGFSCREQIEQLSGRPTLHVAELAAAALGFPVRQLARPQPSPQTLLAAGVAMALGAFGVWAASRAARRPSGGLAVRRLAKNAATSTAAPAPASASQPR
jgi:Fe-S oxidoreductase